MAGLCAEAAKAAARGLLAVAAAAVAAAQPPRHPPTFPVTTRQVQVSVVVHKDGAPVAGLTAADFALFEDGKPQAIESFSVESDRGSPPPSESLPPGTFSNRAASRAGSVSAVLLDRLNTSWTDQRQARDQVVRLLGQIRPDDRVALYLLESTRVRVLHDFTRDTASLLRALGRYRPQTSIEQAVEEERATETDDAEMNAFLRESSRILQAMAFERRAEATSAALEAIANHLAGVPGRKNLVWVSSGFPFLIDQAIGRGSRPDLSQRSFAKEIDRATRAVNDANIAIYPVDARGLMGAFVTPPAALPTTANSARRVMSSLTTLDRLSPALETMEALAENTGGRVFTSSNDIGGAIRRAVEDARFSYVLGYAPTSGKWDGRFRELKVRVKRPGVEVRHRKGYLALPLPPPDAAKTARSLSDALKNPLEATGIALVATAQPTGRADEVNLALQVEARSLTLEKKGDAWEGGFALVIAQSPDEAKYSKSVDTNVDLQLTDALRERLLKQGLVVSKKVALREDAHRIHVLVRDLSTGSMGSLIIPADKLREVSKR